MGVSAAVLGASGYAGGELLRYLSRHPALSITAVAGSTREGEATADVHPHLGHLRDLELVPVDQAANAADVCFSCLPHGVLPDHLTTVSSEVLIDLAQDFRADPSWVYGLPELGADALSGATRVANPGCYPTAALLCLVPFACAGLIEAPVVVNALSGVSGAGRKPQDALLFGTIEGNATAYGTTDHRHVAEIERGLARFGGLSARVSFTPHLVPMTRGLLVTARAIWLGDEADVAVDVLRDAYAAASFVEVTSDWPGTKTVAGTNRARLSARVDTATGFLIASAAIDNLGKGAAGQAIQNANLVLGLPETTGLEAVPAWP
ncbi:MAG: N-acetyl-gamma-glutamyl-phosphate reductase [Actinomycetota bacterium]|nr:N-acetyl-gamma-glutamyl-phosphate reductase [Actinomycetota bacterium]